MVFNPKTWLVRKIAPTAATNAADANGASKSSTKQRGDAAEDAALAHLQAQGLRLVQRNFKTPGRGGGEIDLIMRERDGTLVFVEVRQRASAPVPARAARAPSSSASCWPRGIFCCGSGLSRRAVLTWCCCRGQPLPRVVRAPPLPSPGCARRSTPQPPFDTNRKTMIAPCLCNVSSNNSSTAPI
jgi:putative endonuclease